MGGGSRKLVLFQGEERGEEKKKTLARGKEGEVGGRGSSTVKEDWGKRRRLTVPLFGGKKKKGSTPGCSGKRSFGKRGEGGGLFREG